MASRFSGAFVFETKDGKRYRYRYRAVTSTGAGVHSKDYVAIAACRKLVERLKAQWPDMEIQRVVARANLPEGNWSVTTRATW